MLAWISCTAPATEEGSEPDLELTFVSDPESHDFGTFEARGVSQETLRQLRRRDPSGGWSEVFAVYTGSDLPDSGTFRKPPVAGSHSIWEDLVRFVPAFEPLPGQRYVARWREPDRRSPTTDIVAHFAVPADRPRRSTQVLAVFPSRRKVPENLQKLYLEFSAPMSRDLAREHLVLERLDPSGTTERVLEPFVAPDHELWSPDSRRLTLFFDPGRLKRGVLPNLKLGPPLEAGRRYRLRIEPGWRDARGAPLSDGFEHTMEVGPADRSQPKTEDWNLEPPAGRNRDLALRFPEPLDRALVDNLLAVVGPDGARVEGRAEISDEETLWSFSPAVPWKPGRYQLQVGTALGDLAGNNLRRPFETPLGPVPDTSSEPTSITLDFKVR